MHAGPRPRGAFPTARSQQVADELGWGPLSSLDTVDSTNAVAAQDPRPGTVVVAAHQQAGRGRLGRSWTAPPGAALALSVVLPLPDDTDRRGWLPLLVGVAVTRALTPFGGDYALKWPNDVLARRSATGEPGHRSAAEGPDDGATRPWAKVCGILCQSLEGGLAVVGVGINLDLSEQELPTATATSLHLIGAPADADTLIAGLLTELAATRALLGAQGQDDKAYRAAQRAYRDQCVTLGSPVRLERAGADLHGRAVDVDRQGRIVIESQGERVAHAAGDVVHLRAGGAR